jgi:hypothetical protein
LNKNVNKNADLFFVQAARFAQVEVGDLPSYGFGFFR